MGLAIAHIGLLILLGQLGLDRFWGKGVVEWILMPLIQMAFQFNLHELVPERVSKWVIPANSLLWGFGLAAVIRWVAARKQRHLL